MEETRVVNIYTESNPNPNSLKFVANFMLMPAGESQDFPNIEETNEAPLAKGLFEKFSYVKRVFYMSNFITVTKDESVEWHEVKSEIQGYVKQYLESGESIFTAAPAVPDASSDEPEIETRIKDILDEYIKPAVEMDGGAISFESFNEGKVKVQLQGSCSGCPSSTVTLKSGIENLLKRMVPEVQEVEAEGV